MVEKTVKICDTCDTSIAKNKCPFCEKDVCSECSSELEAGTVSLTTCENCANKVEMVANRGKNFWEEFNKNESMKNKILTYLNKKIILKGLDEKPDYEEGDEEEDYSPNFSKTGGISIKRKSKTKNKGWASAMRGNG